MTLSKQADMFIDLACVKYRGEDNASCYQHAQQLLNSNPKIASHNIYAAIVANDLDAVKGFLLKDTVLARREGGPLCWPPIHYLTYSRINEPSDHKNSLGILRVLLEYGADVNSCRVLNGMYRFTALTGVMGEGEGGARHQPPHQFSKQMAMLLLNAGANPNDSQGLYNTLFEGNSLVWLTLLIDYGLGASHKVNWSEDKEAQSCFDFLLSYAATHGTMERVIFLLAQGADPNVVSVYNQRSAYANAMVAGRADIADYLHQRGAKVEPLNDEDQLRSAISSSNDLAVKTVLARQPALINNAEFLHHAAQNSEWSTVEKLIDIGFDINGISHDGRSILHAYAWEGNVTAVKKLTALGANAGIKDRHHQSTPLGFALHRNASDVIDYLVGQSDNIVEVVACAGVTRARELLTEKPDRVYCRTESGYSLLHIIGLNLQGLAEYDDCEQMLVLLLECGLDINILSDDGKTALDLANENSNQHMIDLLRLNAT